MVMEAAKKSAFPGIGVVFLALAFVQFIQGGNWVVWAILGVIFGGLGIFRSRSAAHGAD
jgi:hypothetical protein